MRPTTTIVRVIQYCRTMLILYAVIKKPMDLGTVLKKVKTQQYKDKKSFADDLNLIWDNCLEYNTWPVSYFGIFSNFC